MSESIPVLELRLARLEAIVNALEEDSTDLAASLALFEEGVACLREAAAGLSSAQARVQQLTELADGAFVLEELDDDA